MITQVTEKNVKRAVANAKNFLASQTWARKTWQQRVEESTIVAVPEQFKTYTVICNYHVRHQFQPIEVDTLCQMQF